MSDDHDRDEGRQPFAFEGLHVYQRTQEAWTVARETLGTDPLERAIEEEIRRAVVGIARATARSRANGGFASGVEEARGSVHAAAAIAEQLVRGGTSVDERLVAHLHDASRMLGALVRSLGADREASEVAA